MSRRAWGNNGPDIFEQAHRSRVLEFVLASLGHETPETRLRKLEARLKEMENERTSAGTIRERAAEKLRRGQPVSRAETAAHLDVSTKKIQRMDAAGELVRCPGLGSVVRYAARDVLRLASASSRKGA